MSDDRHLLHAPVLAESIPEEWTTMIHETLAHQHTPLRAGAEPTIEIQSLTSGKWHPLMLFGGGTQFITTHERDLVIERILNPPPPKPT